MGVTLQLGSREWQLDDERLGEGGFGNVFMGHDVASGERVAIKLVEKKSGADRELLFADAIRASGFDNVLPVIDSGEHGDYLALVMPLAEKSLRAHLQAHPDGLSVEESMKILLDIARALAALNGAVVHRDLKPENVLLLDGDWCVADFGIARAANASTATSTRRQHFSYPYAAPEQWRHEHTTEATDIYAFGVLAFELIEGSRPFPGPQPDDYREQHLGRSAPHSAAAGVSMRALIDQCLLKAPASRPLASDLVVRLERAPLTEATPARSLLAQAYATQQHQRAEEEAAAERAREEARRVAQLQDAGRKAFSAFSTGLRTILEHEAPGIPIGDAGGSVSVSLGEGTLALSAPDVCDVEAGPFHVALYAVVEVRQARGQVRGRSHSLWYCNAFDRSRYDWYELAFAPNGLAGHWPAIRPYALAPLSGQAAFPSTFGGQQLNGPMVRLETGSPEEFAEPWVERLAMAAGNGLPHVNQLPESRDDRRWYRPS